MRYPDAVEARRQFLQFLAASPLAHYFAQRGGYQDPESSSPLDDVKNVLQLKSLADGKLEPIASRYLNGGADDLKTVAANHEDFADWKIRARRLIDVSRIDTSIRLFGREWDSPIMLAPVGFLKMFDPQGEVPVARVAKDLKHNMVVSTLSSVSIDVIAGAFGSAPWFQLYPTPDRDVTEGLLQLASRHCEVLVLTVDTPVIGNREDHAGYLTSRIASGELVAGNLVKLGKSIESLPDPTLDWQFVKWLKERWSGPLVLKGIVTREDAQLCLDNGVDGIIVSNHGGRQLESLRSTISCLPEVVEAVSGRIPVLIDGGFRRGTDIFKALALGAKAICIGRPYLWGLAAAGSDGVQKALQLLQAELVMDMKLAGTPSLRHITRDFVQGSR